MTVVSMESLTNPGSGYSRRIVISIFFLVSVFRIFACTLHQERKVHGILVGGVVGDLNSPLSLGKLENPWKEFVNLQMWIGRSI